MKKEDFLADRNYLNRYSIIAIRRISPVKPQKTINQTHKQTPEANMKQEYPAGGTASRRMPTSSAEAGIEGSVF